VSMKQLTKEQVLETLKRYYPDEQWDDWAEDEESLRLSLIERTTCGELLLADGQFVLYTGIGEQ